MYVLNTPIGDGCNNCYWICNGIFLCALMLELVTKYDLLCFSILDVS